MTATDRRVLTLATYLLLAPALLYLLLVPALDDDDRDLVGVPRPTTSSVPVLVPATASPAVPLSVDPSSTDLSPGTAAETSPPAGLVCGGWGALIAEYFPAGEVGRACEVAACESEFDPDAVSETNDHGLFQIHGGSESFPGGWQVEFERLTGRLFFHAVYEPALNIEFAAWLQSREGWSPWACAR